MGDFDLVTAVDVRLMQGLAQRVTAVRLDLVNSDATFGELAWIWGKGHACDGETWPRRLWFSSAALVAWGWAYLPHQVRRSDGSVQDVTGAYLGYQVHPDHAALVDEVIGWYDAVAADIQRTVMPRVADEAGPEAAVQAHVDAWAPSTYTAGGYEGVRRTPRIAATSTSWWRRRTEPWPRRRSCGSTRPTRPPSLSLSGRIGTTGV
jgi:hypothetical protein